MQAILHVAEKVGHKTKKEYDDSLDRMERDQR